MDSPDTLSGDQPKLAPPRQQTARTISALILREVASTYGNSPGGYLWAILSPIGAIAVMALAFSLMVRTPPLGSSFLLFYATGYLPFNLYSQLSARIGMALRYSRPLLAFPRVTWLDAIIARFLLNGLVWIVVSILVLGAIFALIEAPARIDLEALFLAVLINSIFALAIGVLNCLLIGLFPIWERLWSIITTPLMLASGVLFMYDDMPQLARDILWWNPILHAVSLFREGIYASYHPSWISPLYCITVGLTLLMFGLIFLRSGYRATLEK